MDRIQELEQEIIKNAELYYEGKSVISDNAFDGLVSELRSLDPNNKILHTTGWGYTPVGDGKVKHPIVSMKGLEKEKVSADLVINALEVTPKLDGASVELIYNKGEFSHAITRGNGETGRIANIQVQPIVPKSISSTDTAIDEILKESMISFSGEYIMSKTSLKKLAKSMNTNQDDSDENIEIAFRNIASGFLGRKEGSFTEAEAKEFTYSTYRINGIRTKTKYIPDLKTKLITRRDIYDFIKSLGLETAPIINLVNKSYTFEELITNFNSIYDYDFDGLVVTQNNPILSVVDVSNDNEYATLKIEYPEVAYKTVNETAIVTVTQIEWNMGKTGRFTPRISFTPTYLSGATCEHATAFNAKFVRDNHIGVGTELEVCRSGEIIPFIMTVLDYTQEIIPTVCKHCGEPLVDDGVEIRCVNEDCHRRKKFTLEEWIKVVGEVKGVSGSLIESIINYHDSTNIYEFYKYNRDSWNDFSGDGIGESKKKLVMKVMDKLYAPEIDFVEFLRGINVRLLSTKSSKKISEKTDFINVVTGQYDLWDSGEVKEQIKSINGLGQAVVDSIDKSIRKITKLSYILSTHGIKLKSKKEDKSTSNSDNPKLKVCVTGGLEFGKRPDFFKAYENKIEETSITSCDVLICNEDKGSSKIKKAKESGKTVVTELEFFKLFNKILDDTK